jgi:hypothetical protein
MLKYQFKINEEITRWTTEVLIKQNPQWGWWIAFTNPTAGPWKKITAPNKKGIFEEIYRFNREEKRPDLVLVNDSKKAVLVIEAKYNLNSILDTKQMEKSIKVVKDMSLIMQEIEHNTWNERRKYHYFTSFLWFSHNPTEENILVENNQVNTLIEKEGNSFAFEKFPVNIVIYENEKGDLKNKFVFRNQTHENLDFHL